MRTIQLVVCAMIAMVGCKKDASESDRKETGNLAPERAVSNPNKDPDLVAPKPNTIEVKAIPSPFEKEMASLDSLFYTGVYNNGDTVLAKKMIHADFEFYHDRIGELSDNDTVIAREAMIEKLQDIGKHYKRRLKPGTLRSYPLYNGKELYGAIQQGVNQYHKADTDKLEGTGHFIHLWVKDNHQWKLKRVISFHHEASIP